MAQKRGNGSDASLRDVVAELRGFREDANARLEALSAHVDEGFAKVDARLSHVDARLERVEERLDNIRDFAGEHYRALEERVTRLETKGGGTR